MSQSSTPTPVLPSKPVTPKPAPLKPTETLPLWNVLLHNDEVNDMGFVVESLCRFARLTLPAATRCTMEAHKKGLSLVLSTHREHAELVAEQLTSLRLTVTIEPVR
jgi:ATP-dependent Clp protease adapter protein ClpS